MNNLIEYKDKHMLWQDECQDIFLLTKHLEIWRYSKTTLRCLSFSTLFPTVLKNQGIISTFSRLADGLIEFDISVEILPQILNLDRFKKRPDVKGNWINDKEKRLGHRIKPYFLPYDKKPKTKYKKNLFKHKNQEI